MLDYIDNYIYQKSDDMVMTLRITAVNWKAGTEHAKRNFDMLHELGLVSHQWVEMFMFVVSLLVFQSAVKTSLAVYLWGWVGGWMDMCLLYLLFYQTGKGLESENY